MQLAQSPGAGVKCVSLSVEGLEGDLSSPMIRSCSGCSLVWTDLKTVRGVLVHCFLGCCFLTVNCWPRKKFCK